MSAEQVPLTAAELREIEELKKIVKFRDDIFAGRHPRIKIINGRAVDITKSTPVPAPFQAPAPATVQTPAPALNINFSANHYKALGVEPHVPIDSIRRAYRHKCLEFDPSYSKGQKRRKSGGRMARNAENLWIRIQEAHRILADPVLRRAYDDGRKAFLRQSYDDCRKALKKST